MLQRGLFALLLVTSLVAIARAYPYFDVRIPNGKHVPHPCKPNFVWYGVGHNNSQGGGIRNVFGEAFSKWGNEWNICLCQEDSDGDGRTNGEELGDPNCVWQVGKIPERTTGITHPGVCNSFDGRDCTPYNNWVDCSEPTEFQCDAVNEPGVEKISVNLDRQAVPAKDTTYICQAFNLTNILPPGELHLIAGTPNIDNRNVMHHIIVQGCDDSNGKQIMERFGTASLCGMEAELCRSYLPGWTVGLNGQCINDTYGFPVGDKGFKIIVLQLHWNNPEERSDYFDGSGMDFYVTSKKRPYDGGNWFVGPGPGLVIPPGFPSYSQKGGCNSACTSLVLDRTIYVTGVLPHMHYLGTAFMFQHVRNGVVKHELKVGRYFYDSPENAEFKPALEVLPGDELRVECIFQSLNSEKTVFYGDATSDEMCFAILDYYPLISTLSACLGWGPFGYCNDTAYPFRVDQACSDPVYWGASQSPQIASSCDVNGAECLPGCEAALSGVKASSCYKNSTVSSFMEGLLQYNGWKDHISRLHSCDDRPAVIPGDQSGGNPSVCEVMPPVAGAPHTVAVTSLLVSMVIAVVALL